MQIDFSLQSRPLSLRWAFQGVPTSIYNTQNIFKAYDRFLDASDLHLSKKDKGEQTLALKEQIKDAWDAMLTAIYFANADLC